MNLLEASNFLPNEGTQITFNAILRSFQWFSTKSCKHVSGPLRDVWVHLSNACWKFGVVPSFWKRSITVPIPKGRVKGACDTSNFRGISMTSLVGKIMCMVLNNQLADF